MKRSRCGFTLVELIVVIAIVLLLVGIVLPTLARSKEAAKLNSSILNMRQIGQSILIYAADENDQQPLASDEISLCVRHMGMQRYPRAAESKATGLLLNEVLPASMRPLFRAPFDPGPVAVTSLPSCEPFRATQLKDRWSSYGYADYPPLIGQPLSGHDEPGRVTLLQEPVSFGRNPRMEAFRVGCLSMSLQLRVAPEGECNSQWPEP